jgi:hypothetical protein
LGHPLLSSTYNTREWALAGGSLKEQLFYGTLIERFPCLGDVTYPESCDGHVGEESGPYALGREPPACLVWAADVWQSKFS